MYNLGWAFGTMRKSDMMDGYPVFNTAITANVDTGTYEDRRGILDTYYKYLIASVVAQGGKYMLETEGYEFNMDGDTVKASRPATMSRERNM